MHRNNIQELNIIEDLNAEKFLYEKCYISLCLENQGDWHERFTETINGDTR